MSRALGFNYGSIPFLCTNDGLFMSHNSVDSLDGWSPGLVCCAAFNLCLPGGLDVGVVPCGFRASLPTWTHILKDVSSGSYMQLDFKLVSGETARPLRA